MNRKLQACTIFHILGVKARHFRLPSQIPSLSNLADPETQDGHNTQSNHLAKGQRVHGKQDFSNNAQINPKGTYYLI
jgi:hypothetical protein